MTVEGNRGTVLLGVLWMQDILSALFVGARFWSRTMIDANVGSHDFMMLGALLLNYAALAVLSVTVHYGLGRHQHNLSRGNARQALEFQWIAHPLLVTATIVARMSITILLIRLFPTKRLMKWFLIVAIVLNIFIAIPTIVLVFAQCSPSRKLWDDRVTGGHCINSNIQRSFGLAKVSFSAFSDLATALWPITVICTLRIKRRSKIEVGVLFALTLFAMATSIVEICYVSLNTERQDETYKSILVPIWASTGVNVVIIVGTIPTLRPLQRRWFGSSSYSKCCAVRLNDPQKPSHHALPSRRGFDDVWAADPTRKEAHMTDEEFVRGTMVAGAEQDNIWKKTEIQVTY